ncbi:MAG: efflux transporter periplasmic adaptor subunit [Flavobacteriaceae bacterium]|nr:MAG: efflux transporter periplasmic adaptor subunit [Flavobacteriaceae bacterium]
MKTIFTIILGSLLIISCGESNKNKTVYQIIETSNLELIRQKRAEIVATQNAYNLEIQKLDASISNLDTSKKISLVTTFSVKKEVYNHYLELQGNVTTKNNLVIYPEYAGILTNVYVKEGQKVSKGQTLAKIDDGGLSQQLVQLQIQAELAKTIFERQARLWKQKIGSEIQYLQAKATYNAQEKAVEQLNQQISKTIVKAPFSGIIDDVITEQGSVVAPGQSALIRIINLDNMYVETEVPEKYITQVTKNKKVEIEFPILGETIVSKIRQTANYINPANRTFKIEIGIPSTIKNIKPNLTGKLKINDYTNNNAILIPQSIISENANGEQYIYVVNNKNEKQEGTANRVIVKTGKTQGDVIEILEGLDEGFEIIDEGARSIREGQIVKIINQ